MKDRNTKFYVILVFITLGLVIEGAKLFNDSIADDQQTINTRDLKHSHIKPYHYDSTHETTTRAPKMKTLKTFKTTKFKDKHNSKAPAQKNKIKKKKVTKKKKEKRKKTNFSDVDRERYSQKITKDDERLEDSPNNNSPAIAAVVAVVSTKKAKMNDMSTYKYWAPLVLSTANEDNVTQFVDFYRKKIVPEEVFYQLLTDMYEEGNEPIKLLALQAAYATPSFESFQLLTRGISEHEHGSQVRKTATTYSNDYVKKSRWSILDKIIKSSEQVFAVLIASKIVVDSAKIYLKKQNSPTEEDHVYAQDRERNPNLTQFESFATLIDQVSNNSNDTQVTQFLNQYKKDLDELIKKA